MNRDEMKMVVKMKFGSHVYGTNTPSSDTDYKGVALPDGRSILLQKAFKAASNKTGDDSSKNTSADVDEDIYSLHYFIKQLLEAQTFALDMMFTPEEFVIEQSEVWKQLCANRQRFLHSGVSSFAGYCQSQAAKYSLKGSNLAAYRLAVDFFRKQPVHVKLETILPDIQRELLDVAKTEQMYHDKGKPIISIFNTVHKNTGAEEGYIQVGPKVKVPFKAKCGLAADIYQAQIEKYGARAKLAESNQGVDWKAVSHAVRVCREAEELLLTGNITFPLTDPMVKEIKLGKVPFAQVSEMITDGLDRVSEAKRKTKLPSKPDYQFADDFVETVYRGEV